MQHFYHGISGTDRRNSVIDIDTDEREMYLIVRSD